MAPSHKDAVVFIMTDDSLKGIKAGDHLVCRPWKPGDKAKVAIVNLGGRLVARKWKDAGGMILYTVVSVIKDWL